MNMGTGAFEGTRRRTILKELRIARGMTQREVARKIGKTLQYYSSIERRAVTTAPATQRLLAQVFHIANLNEAFDPDGYARVYQSPVLAGYGIRQTVDADLAPVSITQETASKKLLAEESLPGESAQL